MSVRGSGILVATMLGLAVLVQGCEDGYGEASDGGSGSVTLSKRGSGYSSGATQWIGFLSCWKASVHRHGNVGPEGVSALLRAGESMVHRCVALEQDPIQSHASNALADVERRLRVSLPQSYKDFQSVCQSGHRHSTLTAGQSGKGMFSLDEVERLRKLDPELIDLMSEYPTNAGDEQYYVYGVDQDDVAVRTQYLSDAIAVGRHGHSDYELIVLYPQVLTADGEMEAAALFHSGQFRAPSFAELMRQLSYLETTEASRLPPYPQDELVDTCAEKLPLAGVWWR